MIEFHILPNTFKCNFRQKEIIFEINKTHGVLRNYPGGPIVNKKLKTSGLKDWHYCYRNCSKFSLFFLVLN